MKIHQVKCDNCGAIRDLPTTRCATGIGNDMLALTLPADGTLVTATATEINARTSFDFCSKDCLAAFIGGQRESA